MKNLGIAFQLMDDLLDYDLNSKTLNKNPGDDFYEGKMTLPLIHLIENYSGSDQNTQDTDKLNNIINCMISDNTCIELHNHCEDKNYKLNKKNNFIYNLIKVINSLL